MFVQTECMSGIYSIIDFLDPLNTAAINNDEGYKDGQVGKIMAVYEEAFPDLTNANIIFVGCNEERGNGFKQKASNAADEIRRQFYRLYFWHTDLKLADIGNIKTGATLTDSFAALTLVVKELADAGKTVIILGGSHDITLAQYHVYKQQQQIIEVACVDGLINLDIDSTLRSNNFLMEMLTGEPNYIRHYNHIAFQSYYVHPHMLETMDKLRFDCYRLGHVKDNIVEMEPVIRHCSLFSFDVAAIAHAYAPAGAVSPNGLLGEEACILMQYAGMSPYVNTMGIYGYQPQKDEAQLTAKQISHMLWYFMDGKSKGNREAALEQRDAFNEFTLAFAEVNTIFLQSKKTGRWWMQLPDEKFIACSYKDYLVACNNDIPERWLRAQERN